MVKTIRTNRVTDDNFIFKLKRTIFKDHVKRKLKRIQYQPDQFISEFNLIIYVFDQLHKYLETEQNDLILSVHITIAKLIRGF